MSELHVYTYATHYDGYLPALEEYCKREKIDFNLIGLATKWKGFLHRNKMMYTELKKHNCMCDDPIIMIVDAYDIMLIDSEKNIINKFKSLNKKIVLAVDPKTPWGHYFFGVSVVNSIINYGCMIGYRSEIMKLLKGVINYGIKNNNNDDQIILNHLIHNNLLNIDYCLDYDRKIFNVTFLYSFKKKKDKIVFNNYNLGGEYESSVLHGVSQTDMTNICKELKLKNWHASYRIPPILKTIEK